MLTGDKLETAENIGFSTRMFNYDMTIFKIDTLTEEDTLKRLNDTFNMMNSYNKGESYSSVKTDKDHN